MVLQSKKKPRISLEEYHGEVYIKREYIYVKSTPVPFSFSFPFSLSRSQSVSLHIRHITTSNQSQSKSIYRPFIYIQSEEVLHISHTRTHSILCVDSCSQSVLLLDCSMCVFRTAPPPLLPFFLLLPPLLSISHSSLLCLGFGRAKEKEESEGLTKGVGSRHHHRCVCVCCICTRVHDTRTSNNEDHGEECTETACTRGEREGEDSMENGAKREDAVSCELLLHHHHHAETMKAEWMRKARGR